MPRARRGAVARPAAAAGAVAVLGAVLAAASAAPGTPGTPGATSATVPTDAGQPTGGADIVVVDRDDVVVRGSAIVRFTGEPIVDDEGDGVLHVEGDGTVVRLIGHLRGARSDATPESLEGVGIAVRGEDVSIAGGRVSGFRVGLEAVGTDGLAIVGLELDGGFRQRLRSTPQAEATGDWLWPHVNDGGEWAERYGAALRVVDASNVSLREITVRNWQNGLMLERVTDSVVADCDASFLSGWGLALWRVERTLVARNAFDFCIRGYSHGVYNRGQDSAGILMFEQCSDNVVVRNSATHGGNGLFGFAGRTALGDVPEEERRDAAWYRGRGCNGNLFAENDFSHAAAHGLELTFSFGNRITANAFTGNAICGVWAGFSQDTLIDGNELVGNGEAGYGLERGGVNVEHGSGNRILANVFRDNACGVHLWNDPAEGLYALPWGQANEPGSRDNAVIDNVFTGNETAIHLRDNGSLVLAGNELADAGDPPIDADEASRAAIERPAEIPGALLDRPPVDVDAILAEAGIGPGRDPRGARAHLGGRAAILMNAYGPWDHEGLLLRRVGRTDLFDEWQVLGPDGPVDPRTLEDRLSVRGEVQLSMRDESFAVLPALQPLVAPYELRLAVPGGRDLVAAGTVRRSQWNVVAFPWERDPLEDPAGWRRDADRFGVSIIRFGLRLPFGDEGPAEHMGLRAREAGIPPDRFGVLGETSLQVPAGRWRLRTTSDDGIRVRLDDELVIDDWTIHAPREAVHEFTVENERMVLVAVEYFENTGYAWLDVDLEWVGPLAEGD